jgi:hypothetical protein
VLLHTPPVKEYAIGRAREYVRRNYGAELNIDRADYSLLTGEITIHGVSVRSLAAGMPIFQLKYAHINLSVPSLFSGPLYIRSAILRGVALHVVINENGTSNLPQFKSSSDSGSGLLIQSMEIRDASVDAEDFRQHLAVQIPSLKIQVQARVPGLVHEIFVQSNTVGTVKYEDQTFQISNIDIQSQFSPDKLRLDKLTLIGAGSNVQGAGVIRDFSNPAVDLTFDTEIDLSQTAAAAGLLSGIQGRARGKITVTGPIDNLHIKGRLQSNIN